MNSIEIRISVKSMFQTELENMMGKSGLKMKLDAPQDVINDPTMEIKRMHAFVSFTPFHQSAVVSTVEGWAVNARRYLCVP